MINDEVCLKKSLWYGAKYFGIAPVFAKTVSDHGRNPASRQKTYYQTIFMGVPYTEPKAGVKRVSRIQSF